MPLRGGIVRWYRDIRPLRRQQQRLQRVSQALERSYDLLCRAGEIKRQAVDQEVRRRIYGELEDVIARKRPPIRTCLDYLREAEPGQKTDAVISRLHVLACYLKKRCVLLLRSQEEGQLDARELELAVDESLRYLERAGLRGHAGFALTGLLPSRTALQLYDIFEEVAEAALTQGETYWLCQFQEVRDGWRFSVVLDVRDGADWLTSWQGLAAYPAVVRLDETGYGRRLTVSMKKERENG